MVSYGIVKCLPKHKKNYKIYFTLKLKDIVRFGSSVIPQDTTSFLPFFGTDIGLCSVIKPQVLIWLFRLSTDYLNV